MIFIDLSPMGNATLIETAKTGRYDIQLQTENDADALSALIPMAFARTEVECLSREFEIAKNEVSLWQTYFSLGFFEATRTETHFALILTRDMWLDGDTEEDKEDAFNPYDSFRLMF